MLPLLYLVHRIPYPPNKGDKVRSFHLLKALSKQYDIYLGAFVDNKDDWQYATKLDDYCAEVKLQSIRQAVAKVKSLMGLITGEALSLQYYKDSELQIWVDEIIEKHSIRHVLVFSSTMAQYVLDTEKRLITKRIADFVDIDSDKWRQYSQGYRPPMSWIYAREAKKLLEFEKSVANIFDATLFVSKAEKNDFDKLSPESVNRHAFYNNGVDSDYFDPQLPYSNPFQPDIKPIVFTGAMDYWANIDSVKWFVNEVFQNIHTKCETARFYIVGSSPSDEVLALGRMPGVVITGSVDDIRPYIRYASITVAPLRIARGIQNKVLEAMAMAKPIVARGPALEGIEMCKNYKPLRADTPAEFVDKCILILNGELYGNGIPEARQCILENYNWDNNVQIVLDLLEK